MISLSKSSWTKILSSTRRPLKIFKKVISTLSLTISSDHQSTNVNKCKIIIFAIHTKVKRRNKRINFERKFNLYLININTFISYLIFMIFLYCAHMFVIIWTLIFSTNSYWIIHLIYTHIIFMWTIIISIGCLRRHKRVPAA